jgi:hypothetical protein
VSTLSDLRSTLRSLGNFPAADTRITDAVIDREINRALKRIAMVHDWPWLQKVRTIITAADLGEYPIPTDFLRALSVRIGTRNLYLRSPQEKDQDSRTGQPTAWTIWAGRFEVAPMPDGEYEIEVRYIRQENVLVQDTDAPLIPDYWEDGLLDAALSALLLMVARPDEAGLAESRFQTWIRETQDNIQQTRGAPRVRVRPGSQWPGA